MKYFYGVCGTTQDPLKSALLQTAKSVFLKMSSAVHGERNGQAGSKLYGSPYKTNTL